MRYEEQEAVNESQFWRIYLGTAAIVLAVGLLPSFLIIYKQGFRVVLPEDLRKESVSDVLAQEWIVHPKCVTTMTGRERGEILLELTCTELSSSLVAYYEEQFEKQGYVQKIERKEESTVIMAKKGEVVCRVKISGFSVQIIVSKAEA